MILAILKTHRVAGSPVAVIVADTDLSFRQSVCAQEVAPGRIRRPANLESRGRPAPSAGPAKRGKRARPLPGISGL